MHIAAEVQAIRRAALHGRIDRPKFVRAHDNGSGQTRIANPVDATNERVIVGHELAHLLTRSSCFMLSIEAPDEEDDEASDWRWSHRSSSSFLRH
jgi:hypothetical protein